MKKLLTIKEDMAKMDLDALFISKEENVNYLSGFTDEASYLLITKGKSFFITDGRFVELAEELCLGFTIINWQKTGKGLFELIADLCQDLEIKKLGFEADWISYSQYQAMEKDIRDIDLVGTNNMVEKLRYVKDDLEISYLRKACEISDYAFEEILKYIKPGVKEKDLAARLEYIMKTAGADGIGFDTILISGKKTSLPHGKPSDKLIEKGDFITMDYGALVNGYTADMTRTVIVGEASDEQIKVYNLVKKAQEKALESLKAGIDSSIPDKAARSQVQDYIDYYYPGIGHGIGLDLHEAPFLSHAGGYEIKENSVITVEPGLYIPSWGGVRIEDSVLIKKNGYERLTKSTKELIIID